MWYNYVKMQNLEKCEIDYFYWIRNLGSLDNDI